MPKTGRRRLREAIQRANVPFIATETDLDSIEQRMALYREHAGDRYIQATVNVGGPLASSGPKTVKRLYRPGLNVRLDPHAVHVDSVMKRFLRDGVPVVNLSKIVPLAELYGLPLQPGAPPQRAGGAPPAAAPPPPRGPSPRPGAGGGRRGARGRRGGGSARRACTTT